MRGLGEKGVLFPEKVVDVDDLSEFNCVSCVIIDRDLELMSSGEFLVHVPFVVGFYVCVEEFVVNAVFDFVDAGVIGSCDLYIDWSEDNRVL